MGAPIRRLHERDVEVAALHAALGDAVEGRGTALMVQGEAGIGKSSLLEAARCSATERGMHVLVARAAALEIAVAHGVARQLLLPVLLADGGTARLLHGAAALAGPALLGAEDDAPPGGESAFAARHGLCWLVAGLAREGRPLALLVDDLHWADAPSARFLAVLAARIADLPVALVLAARPAPCWSDPALERELLPHVRTLAPARLSPAGVSACLAAQLGTTPDPDVTEAAHLRTGGTPYLVDALGRALRESRSSPTAAAVADLDRLGAAEIGRDVAARVASLPPDARELVAAIAVIGDGRPASDAAGVAGLGDDDAASAVATLQGSGLVGGGPEPAFEHPLVRTALLDGLDAARRAALHERAAALAARRGELERAAAHLAQAPGRGDPERVALLQRVGERAMRSGASDVAVGHLRRALAEPPPHSAAGDLLMSLGLAEMALGDPGAADRLVAAADALDDADLALRARMSAGYALTYAGRWPEGFARMREAIACGADAGREPLAVARLELAAALMTGVPTGAEAFALLAALDREIDPGARVRPLLDGMLAVRDTLRAQPRAPTLALLGSSGVVVARDVGGGALRGMRMIALVLADDFAAMTQTFDAAVADARTRGDLTTVRVLSAWHALGLARQGRLAEGAEALLGVEEDPARTPIIATLVAAAAGAAIALDRGDLALARRTVAPPLEDDPGAVDVNMADDYLAARARVRLAEGDAAAAAQLFARVGASQTRWGAESPPVTQWRTGAAEAARVLGDLDHARALAEEEVGVAERHGAPRSHAAALRTRARVAGPTAAGEADLRDALDRLDGEPLELERARVCADLGDLLLASGRERAAREPLRIALDLGWRCGADALAARAQAALVATGARPRRPLRSGRLALTAAEARTARLAGAMGNREIAERLFVTEKTVESHLTAAYRKLGISGRTQLADALDHPG